MLDIPFSDVMLVILMIFAFVGVMRGFWKEGITALFAGTLALLIWKPEIIYKVVDIINQMIQFFLEQFGPTAQFATGDYLDPSSLAFQVALLSGALVASYLIGGAAFGDTKVTALSRLLGGLLGLFNGFVIASLIRLFLINDLQAKFKALDYSAADSIAIRLTSLPAENLSVGYGIIFIIIVLVGVVALLLVGDRLKLPLK